MDGPKDPWPRVLSLPGAQGGFVGDPTSLAHDNILLLVYNERTGPGLYRPGHIEIYYSINIGIPSGNRGCLS